MDREVGDRNGYPAQGGISAQIDPIVNGEEYTDAITCGRSAFKSLEKTEIADINAGEEVGFKTSDSPGYNGGSMLYFHEGPGSAWLSRAPKDDLKSYQGDGDWFKIAYAGPKSNTEWKLLYKDSVRTYQSHLRLCINQT